MKLVIPIGEDDHIRGSLNAPAVLVEYGDYQCTHCGRAHFILKALLERFADDLCFVFRNMPLTQAHPYAQLAAEAAEAAAAQGRFWEMHNALYENQPTLGPELISDLAQALDLDIDRFEEDLATHRFYDKVRRDFMGGVRSGANGTPTFFINGERYEGAVEEEKLAATLEQNLSHPDPIPPDPSKSASFSRKEHRDRQA